MSRRLDPSFFAQKSTKLLKEKDWWVADGACWSVSSSYKMGDSLDGTELP